MLSVCCVNFSGVPSQQMKLVKCCLHLEEEMPYSLFLQLGRQGFRTATVKWHMATSNHATMAKKRLLEEDHFLF